MSENPPKMPPDSPTEEDEPNDAQSPTALEISVPKDKPVNSPEIAEGVQLESSKVNPLPEMACGLQQGEGGQRKSENDGAEAGSLPPLEGSPPPVENSDLTKKIYSCESVMDDLNKLLRSLNRTRLPEGKARVFQMYLQDPKLSLPTSSETRTCHNAGRQTEQGATESAPENREIPINVLNQARALLGYTGPSPQRDPDAPQPCLISKASNIPIHQAYLCSSAPYIVLALESPVAASQSTCTPEERAPSGERSSRGFSEFDSSSSGKDASPPPDVSAQSQRSGLDVKQAADIPSRLKSDPSQSTSYLEIRRPMVACRRFSLEFDKCVIPSVQEYYSSRSSESTANLEMNRPLFKEPSVELDQCMTKDGDNGATAARSTVNPQPAPRTAPEEQPSESAPEKSKSSRKVKKGKK